MQTAPNFIKHPFISCLSQQEIDLNALEKSESESESDLGSNRNGSNEASTTLTAVLKRAMSVDEMSEKSWLSSSVIDLVFSKFAQCYKHVEYLSIDFILLALNDHNRKSNNFEGVTNILGQTLEYNPTRPIILLYNSNNIHWTLIRIQHLSEPTIQLFEPMGKPRHRTSNRPLSYRDIPKGVVTWLDTVCPLPKNKSWLTVTSSAITKQQQYTSFDCGVACLLYAEKCGMGYDQKEINDLTSQEQITEYRKLLQTYVNKQKLSMR